MALTPNEVLEAVRDELEKIKVPDARTAGLSSTWSELDVDSLDLVELVKALEDRFGVEITDEQLRPVESVGAAVHLVLRLSDGDDDEDSSVAL